MFTPFDIEIILEVDMKDKAFWNNFYTDQNSQLPQTSKFLKHSLEFLRKGKVLDVACGTGWNSLFLAENGFTVEGIDFSETAISQAIKKAQDAGLNVEFKQQSLDFYLAPIQKYDTVVVTDYKCSGRLLDEMRKGLVIGGTLLIECFTVNHVRNNPGTYIEVEDCYKAFELARLLKDWNLLCYDERIMDGEYRTRAVAIKPAY
jgi:tellurite methyltransferase